MLVVAAVFMALMLVPCTGGSFRRLGAVDLRSSWLLALALAGQLAVTVVVPGGSASSAAGIHVATYALVAIWLLRNWRLVPGLWVAGVGGALNFVAIGANGGTMPARAAALARAGIPITSRQFANSAVIRHPRLLVLGDVLAVPKGWPLANVFSVGDVLLALGVIVAIVRICRLQPAELERSAPDAGRARDDAAVCPSSCGPTGVDLRTQARRQLDNLERVDRAAEPDLAGSGDVPRVRARAVVRAVRG